VKPLALDAGAVRLLTDAAAAADARAVGTPEAIRAYTYRAHVSSTADMRTYSDALHAVGYLSRRENGTSQITAAGRAALKRAT
jgi:hypothetical protein